MNVFKLALAVPLLASLALPCKEPVPMNLIFLPIPKQMEFGTHTLRLKSGGAISLTPDQREDLFFTAQTLKNLFKSRLEIELSVELHGGKNGSPAVEFTCDPQLKDEAYDLQIEPDGIRIRYGAPAGAFRSVATLKQLVLQCGKQLPCGFIRDEPDFKVRGISFDVSRNRIPTPRTLRTLVDLMADLKLNQLQLYTEGFSFAYSSYPDVWRNGTPLTGEEIVELDRYCRERFIDLVPNQNSFGHMDAWLRQPEFHELAECPDGFWFNPSWFMAPGTVNPSDARTMELIEHMQDDLLPYFSSKLYNVCCDETYELGKGKSKDLAQKVGAGRIYLDFLKKLRDLAQKRGKQIMFWADIMSQNPKLIADLPKDAIALEWGYEAGHPFKSHGARYKDAGISYYVCPGTSSWYSFAGRTDNMKQNLLGAAVSGKEQGAAGYLNTYWGDIAHYHHLPVGYPGFAYGAAVSWGVEQNKSLDLAASLDRFIFMDQSGKMGKLVLDLGNYYLLEKLRIHDGTILGRILFSPLEDLNAMRGMTSADFAKIRGYVEGLIPVFDEVALACDDACLVVDEYRNMAQFILHACRLGELKGSLKADPPQLKPMLAKQVGDASALVRDFRRLWLSRNRPGNGYTDNSISGLDEAVRYLEQLKKQCADKLKSLN